MKLTLLNTAIALSLASSISTAATSSTYRGELDLEYLNNENDANAGQIGFKWYFQPVTNSFKKMFKKTIRHPLAESAFLEKSSSLSFKYSLQRFDDMEEFDPSKLNFDTTNIDFSTINDVDDVDLSQTKISIEYFIPKSIFYVGIQYNRTNLQLTKESEEDIKTNAWWLTAGIMIADNFLLSTNYIQDEDYKINANAKYVVELGGGTAVNFLASYNRLDNKNIFTNTNDDTDPNNNEIKPKKDKDFATLSADYYFDPTFSVGTGLLYNDDTGYELRVQKFFSDAISVRLMYRSFEEDTSYVIGLRARL